METVIEIAEWVRHHLMSAREALDKCRDLVERNNGRLTAFTYLLDRSGACASRIDDEVAGGGDPGPLAGVPLV